MLIYIIMNIWKQFSQFYKHLIIMMYDQLKLLKSIKKNNLPRSLTFIK